MGLKLRYYLFYGVNSESVAGALQSFYISRGRPLERTSSPRSWLTDPRTIEVYAPNNNWVVVGLNSGWEWKERREAQLLVSERLWCPGFLVFVYDGEYWGYEFFDQGKILDHFVQQADEAQRWFPGEDCRGDANLLVAHLPFLDVATIGPYLQQYPTDGDYPRELKGKVRPNDEFDRFDECAVLDFLRALGIEIGLREGYVTPHSPIYRSFWMS